MSAHRPFLAQLGVEITMTLRRGETLLVTVGIPVAFLVFFSTSHVVGTGPGPSISFFLPGMLALAVMSTAMVSLGIATGFERSYGVLKRLGSTPLGRPRLLGAKVATVFFVEVLQAAVLVPVGYALGWAPLGTDPGAAVAATLLGTVAFGSLGLFLAGVLRAELNLAATNGLYIVLLLLGGMIVPLAKLPGALEEAARALPGAALSDALHATLGSGGVGGASAWVTLGAWALGASVAAVATFRFE